MLVVPAILWRLPIIRHLPHGMIFTESLACRSQVNLVRFFYNKV